MASDVVEAAGSASQGFLDELKKIGKSALGQITGGSGDHVPDEKELEKLKEADKEFSQTEVAQLRSKIAAMYQSYDVLKKKEEKLEAEQKKQQEEFAKLEEINELRQSDNAVNVNVKTAVGKASVETGKSYGTE